MYSCQRTEVGLEDEEDELSVLEATWTIFDPNGNVLAIIETEEEARRLVAHLNR